MQPKINKLKKNFFNKINFAWWWWQWQWQWRWVGGWEGEWEGGREGENKWPSLPEPSGEEPTLRLCTLPFLSGVGDFWRLELVTLPAADATDDVGEAEETER